jgi:hypothetical protein
MQRCRGVPADRAMKKMGAGINGKARNFQVYDPAN